jgi:glutathione S-transferase
MIHLYYSWYSICSEKVLVCLFEKALPFTGHHIDLFNFDQIEPAYLKINPDGAVPALVDDGVTVRESTVINEYLDEAYPERRLSPDAPQARAEMRYWVQRFQDVVFPAAGLLSQQYFIVDELRRRWPQEEIEARIRRKIGNDRVARQLRAAREGLSAQELAAADERIRDVLDAAEARLADGRDWLAGDFSLADVAAAPNIHRFTIIERRDLIDARPRLRLWAARLLERPSVEQTYVYAPSVPRPTP